MKKLIFILSLLIASCGYESPYMYENMVVKETGVSLNSNLNDLCYYICSGSIVAGASQMLSNNKWIFYDSCGKYKVGDTIIITKKF
jgi:hypothetical protein